jgi:hypothetical protein
MCDDDPSALYVALGWTQTVHNTSYVWANLLEPTQTHTSPADVCQPQEHTNLTEPTPWIESLLKKLLVI